MPTGFIELDELTNGLHPGQMIVVAARPAVGKSTLGIDIARAAAIKHNMAAAVFSLEMSRTEITMRILSAEATIQLQDLRKGLKNQEQWTKLARIMGKISNAPLFIDDSPNMSLMEIRAKCRRLKQQHNLRLVVIDYLQLMSSGKKVESRQQEVAEFSRALKLLAKELEVPVIAISQLNRGPEQRTDKRPQMSDLRESGSIEQDADVVILLHRDRSDPERDGRPTSSWPSTVTAPPRTSCWPSRATTPGSTTWPATAASDPSPPASVGEALIGPWSRAVGASSHELSDRHGVMTGSATSSAPASTSRRVCPAASSTSSAIRIRGLGVAPASTRSMLCLCAGLAISRVARPASRMATRSSPPSANAASSGIPSTSR